jgi:hypothetical protein
MTRRVLALAAAFLMLAAVNAQAQDDEEEEELYFEKDSAAYIGLVASYAHYDINESNKDTGGAGVILGAHVTPWLAMEGQYEFHESSKTSLGSYNLKFVFLHDRVQPFVKGGIGIMGGRPNHAFLLMGRASAGVDFFLNEQVALSAIASYAGAKHSNHVYIGSLGVTYYFE